MIPDGIKRDDLYQGKMTEVCLSTFLLHLNAKQDVNEEHHIMQTLCLQSCTKCLSLTAGPKVAARYFTLFLCTNSFLPTDGTKGWVVKNKKAAKYNSLR